jgi:hypothetical protein
MTLFYLAKMALLAAVILTLLLVVGLVELASGLPCYRRKRRD